MTRNPSREDFALFNLELANLVRSGLPLAGGLKLIAREVNSAAFRGEIEKVEKRVQSGQPLSEALAGSPAIFSSYYITLIKAGERGGSLPEVLHHLTRYATFQARTQGNILTGLSYPVFVLLIAAVIYVGIAYYIVPRFEELYAAIRSR